VGQERRRRKMGYKLSGTMVTGCECDGPLCPCNVDKTPNTPNGKCQGVMLVGVKEGSLDDLDLAGVDVALVYTIPGNPGAGDWSLGLVVDEAASEEQAQALERIIRGDEGGMWGDFSALFGEWRGTQRAAVSVSNGDSPSGSVAGIGNLSVEPFRDGEGNITRVKNAAFGLGPEFTIGQASGTLEGFGVSFDASYGDTVDFEWAS
jgi:hypothetical protein